MIFQSLELEYKGMHEVYDFKDKTLLYSEKNSVGKSTLLRLLFFGVGYPIPGTYGLKFKDIEVIVAFERNGDSYHTKRLGNYIELFRNDEFVTSRNLSSDDDDWLSYIWGISSVRVLRNILGAIYMDQDKGWTLLNRGKVIGNIRFNIRDLLIGLSSHDEDLSEKLSIIDNQKKLLRQTRVLLELAKIAGAGNASHIEDVHYSDDKLGSSIKSLTLKQRVLKNRIASLERNIKEQQGLGSFIASLHLMIKIDQKEILVNEDNLLRFDENIDYLKQKSAWIQSDLEVVTRKLALAKKKAAEQTENLFDEDDVVSRTLSDISSVHLNEGILESRQSELTQSINSLNKIVESEFTENNELISETRGWVQVFAERLGVSEYVQDKKYIFTRDLKSISGTVYYKVVFCFKMAYIKMIEKYTEISLPIVLDSPSGREVTDRNISAVIEILNDYFETNQLIIASIRTYQINGITTITLHDRIFTEDGESNLERQGDFEE